MFVVTLITVEQDNGDLAKIVRDLQSAVGESAKKAAVNAASTAAGTMVGAAIGSIVPGVGTAVGAAVGALAGAAYDTVLGEVVRGLEDDVLPAVPLSLVVQRPADLHTHPSIGVPLNVEIRGDRGHGEGAHYGLTYEWHLV